MTENDGKRPRMTENDRLRPKNSEYIHNIIPFSLYRKFLKSSEMVYNELEIKNDMTKERMCWIRHDVVYEVFFVVNF